MACGVQLFTRDGFLASVGGRGARCTSWETGTALEAGGDPWEPVLGFLSRPGSFGRKRATPQAGLLGARCRLFLEGGPGCGRGLLTSRSRFEGHRLIAGVFLGECVLKCVSGWRPPFPVLMALLLRTRVHFLGPFLFFSFFFFRSRIF